MVFPVCTSDNHFVNISPDKQHLKRNVFEILEHLPYPCPDPESFARGGPTLTFFFLFILFIYFFGKEGILILL